MKAPTQRPRFPVKGKELMVQGYVDSKLVEDAKREMKKRKMKIKEVLAWGLSVFVEESKKQPVP